MLLFDSDSFLLSICSSATALNIVAELFSVVVSQAQCTSTTGALLFPSLSLGDRLPVKCVQSTYSTTVRAGSDKARQEDRLKQQQIKREDPAVTAVAVAVTTVATVARGTGVPTAAAAADLVARPVVVVVLG